MKKRITIIVILLFAVFLFLYLAKFESQVALESSPERELKISRLENIKTYKERFERNSYHLEKALKAIEEVELALDTASKNLSEEASINLEILRLRSSVLLENIMEAVKEMEKNPNVRDDHLLDEALDKLNLVNQEVIGDSLTAVDVYDAFSFTLNALAKAELNITEAAGKSNQKDLARLALKQAQAHVKNAFLLEHSIRYNNAEHFDLEVDIFRELDSLIENKLIPTKDLNKKIDGIIKELDVLLEKDKK